MMLYCSKVASVSDVITDTRKSFVVPLLAKGKNRQQIPCETVQTGEELAETILEMPINAATITTLNIDPEMITPGDTNKETN
jgi:hypothetical protein